MRVRRRADGEALLAQTHCLFRGPWTGRTELRGKSELVLRADDSPGPRCVRCHAREHMRTSHRVAGRRRS
ncbi:hypothetical protein D187_002098 [Cystobacter fuscus DSM 2262]|uniref:Uncharacterized protein n=1 Tax=Cystobacter fuscus (strain ATCC 25194 / DSM 2262 / NBRC 100088 / M29) TaxID=1242864 RepID=S9PCK2_CYSF2|nr:hypothetical protein D187_002098 [Cystobacter fuscus DSM 2262]